MHKIMLVEDDRVLQEGMKKALEGWGMDVVPVMEFDRVLQRFSEEKPHLLVLDITLPLFNGYYWCQEIRKISKVPILFVSSHDQPMDIVTSIQMGADDYVTKPFDLSVFVAKVQGLLRRSYEFSAEQDGLEYGGVLLDLRSTKVHYRGKTEELTKNEFQILRVLMEHRDGFVSREGLMEAMWEGDAFVDDNTLTVNVARLRKKLESMGIMEFIITKKGIGYGVVK